MDVPKPDINLLPDLFEYLDKQAETVEVTLRENFTIEDRDGHEIIVFEDATRENYLNALYEESEVMVPFFMKLTGLTRRVFARREGIDHIDLMKGWSQKGLRETEKGQTFAKACKELMPPEMYLETALFSFYKSWEVDK